MYKLPPGEDFSFLVGKEVSQLCIGLYDVQLHFLKDSPISIGVDPGPVRSFDHRTSHPRSSAVGRMPAAAATLVSLLGTKIQRVVVEDTVTLAIYFDNNEELRIFDSSDCYESFTIGGPDGLIIV